MGRTDRAEPPEARGVFETLPFEGGHLILFDEHCARFVAGCAHFGFAAAPGAGELRDAALSKIADSGLGSGIIRWSAWAAEGDCAWAIHAETPRPHSARQAWRAKVAQDRLSAPGPESTFKHLGRRTLLTQLAAARAAGHDEVLFLDHAGRLVEGAVSNLFCVRDGDLLTPPTSSGALPGIVRARVLALAPELGIAANEEAFGLETLRSSQEAFVTNSLVGIRPLSGIDDRLLPAPGPVTARLSSAYNQKG